MSLLSFAICAKNPFRHQSKEQYYSIMYDNDWYPKFYEHCPFLKTRLWKIEKKINVANKNCLKKLSEVLKFWNELTNIFTIKYCHKIECKCTFDNIIFILVATFGHQSLCSGHIFSQLDQS